MHTHPGELPDFHTSPRIRREIGLFFFLRTTGYSIRSTSSPTEALGGNANGLLSPEIDPYPSYGSESLRRLWKVHKTKPPSRALAAHQKMYSCSAFCRNILWWSTYLRFLLDFPNNGMSRRHASSQSASCCVTTKYNKVILAVVATRDMNMYIRRSAACSRVYKK